MNSITAQNTHALGQGTDGFRQALAARFERAATAWSRYVEYRQAVQELQACSDRALRDLGIYRGDIRRLVYESTYR